MTARLHSTGNCKATTDRITQPQQPHTSAQHDEQSASAAKHVDRLAIVRLTLRERQQLGRHVRYSAASRRAHCGPAGANQARRAEIGQLEVKIRAQEEILELDVAVHHAGRVARVEPRHKLVKVRARQRLVERTGLD